MTIADDFDGMLDSRECFKVYYVHTFFNKENITHVYHLTFQKCRPSVTAKDN